MAARVDVGVDPQRDARARLPLARASASIRSSSPSDSALIGLDAEIDRLRQLGARLADAGEDDLGGMNPARSATSISPPEFASAPLPSPRRSRAIASVEFAFSA